MRAPSNVHEYVMQERSKKEQNDSSLNIEGAWAAVGFAVVLLLFGVPVWWRTTTVYRAPLPYSIINQNAGMKRAHFVPITVLSQEYADCVQFSTNLQTLLNQKIGEKFFCLANKVK